MFCPNCGNDCGEANFCSNCGHDLGRNSQPSSIAKSGPDMEYYFSKYGKDRIGAIQELRIETGWSPMVAKAEIDKYFDQKQSVSCASAPDSALREVKKALNLKKSAFKEKKADLDASGQVYCPKCLSTSVTANQKGFGFARGALGASIGLDVGLIAGGIGSKKVICTCLKCGYQWKPGKK